jgi:hypothetical protein
VVILGMVAMVFGIGRLGATQGELQSFADNVALAAAGELDGKTDAITRATAAAANLISDTQTFGSAGAILSGPSDYSLVFHSALPPSDLTVLGADVTTDPALAVFAQVTVAPVNVSMPFTTAVNALLGGGTTPTAPAVSAETVAGFTQEACDISPLMFCLPSPTYTAETNIGNLILLRSGGNNSLWGPGDFGFLDPSNAELGATCEGLGGVNLLICQVGAEQNITQCYTTNGVDMEPGQKVGIEDAVFNIRFDIYTSTLKGEKNDPNYLPAPNVIKGIVANGGGPCVGQGNPGSIDTMALPKDTCFYSGTCASPSSRFGDGVWDYDGYIDYNHGNKNGVLDVGEDAHLTQYSVNPKYAGTRYETYLREIQYGDSGVLPNYEILNGLAETGRPSCSPYQSIHPERRVVIAAGIDCIANPISGAQTGVPVEEFFELFLTEPVGTDGGSPAKLGLWVEIIGSAGDDGYSAAGAGGLFRDVVQLYR